MNILLIIKMFGYVFCLYWNSKKILEYSLSFSVGRNRLKRVQEQIQTQLSPKFTTMEGGGRLSRFGRPQKEAKQDINSIPTEVARFISKFSPKKSPKLKKPTVGFSYAKEREHDESSDVFGALFNGTEKSGYENVPDQVEVTDSAVNDSMIIEEKKVSPVVQNDMDCDQCSIDLKTEKAESGFEDEVHKENRSDDGSDEKCKQDFSDTDSALGSAVSFNDIKANKGKGTKDGEDFFAGQILWGSFGNLSWYPCMVYPNDNEGNVTIGKRLRIHLNYSLYNLQPSFRQWKIQASQR